MMKKSDLYREWARVLDMCEGTNVDPGKCVKIDGILILTTSSLDARGDRYSFAVAILEDKPVFVGDAVWHTSLNRFIEIQDGAHIRLLISVEQATWQPPKKTFMLNGEELPCPQKDYSTFNLDLNTWRGAGREQGRRYYFTSQDDLRAVESAIHELLQDATK